MKFGVGVIGATGFIGTPYRREIRQATDDARIVALCARRRDLLEAAGREDGAELITDDWRELVAHPEVNFVIVATPDALHHEVVMACAEQGRHLLCEKPLAAHFGQARQMWTAYRRAGLGHYVPFWTRYVECFQRARQIVAEGTLGQVRVVIYRWQNPRPANIPFTWRDNAELSSSGSIGDVGSHAYDTICWILGEQARRVLAHAGVITPDKLDIGTPNLAEALQRGRDDSLADNQKRRKGTAFDYADIAIEFHGGAVGSLVLSHAPAFRKGLAPELELHGSEASLSVDRISGTIKLARPDEDPQTVDTLPHTDFGNRFAKYVFPAVRQRAAGQPCEHPGLEDGLRSQIFTDAAATSSRLGKWVELAEDGENE